MALPSRQRFFKVDFDERGIKMAWRECPICYSHFKQVKVNQKYCPECRKYRKDEIRQYLEENKAREKILKKKPIKSIEDISVDIRDYNKKHGTHLTYGKYVSLKEMGRLKGESDD